jgi:SAM-dependent methyltransferase
LTVPRPGELRETLRRLAPRADWSGPLELLIAGCGTGRQAIVAALGYGPARVLACDLSAASLGWAAHRAARYGAGDVEFLQADLRDAPHFGRRFDVIECAGVLHHMADPEEGWRRLVEALAPGGLMLVALYSETARRPIVAARDAAARGGFAATAEDIRRFRRQLLVAGDDWAQEIRRNPDFYDLSGARDMLFHVHERRFALPQIGEMLARLGLECRGIEVGAATAEAYRRRFPDDPAMRSLENWTAFEAGRPRSFRGMYQVWCARA